MTERRSKDFGSARLWAWLEKSLQRRFLFAAVLGGAAATLHWAIFPVTQGRVTFIFFLPAIVLATQMAGRGPGILVAVIGLVNSALMKPAGSLLIWNSSEQIALISAAVAAALVVMVGDYYRSISRRQLTDLNDLHELSAALASVPRLPEQLQLILSTYARMLGARFGLITIFDATRNSLEIAASTGLTSRTLDAVRGAAAEGRTPSALACLDNARLIVEDIQSDPRVESVRELARAEDVRALHATPLVGRDGRPLGAITVYFGHAARPTDRDIRIADICARNASVFLERARAEELVSQRDRRFQSVLEVSGVPFIVMTPIREEGRIVDFRYTYANTAAAHVMRSTPDRVIGRPVLEVTPRAWDDPERFQIYLEALERNEVREIERHTAADGNVAWYHIVASPLDGDLAIWFADITNRKKQERELLDADRRKDEFLATLAHELRNPLAPIRQAARIASNENATDAQKRWSNNVIERQVQHMSLLLDDLLEVSRITHGTLHLRKQPIDLQSVLEAAIETARPIIDERRHQLDLDVPEELRVNGDPLRLAQVLSNLLTNAAKYTNPQGTIRVQARRQDADVVITVDDSGFGIDAEDLPRVFGMFAQVRAAQEHSAGGLGIGLALAKGIVEMHGGRIEASSAGLGQGSRFTVRLPAMIAAAPAETVASRPANGNAAPNKRILLADDNRDAAESLAIILRLEGHEVELAHDGLEALRAFGACRPDVALLDIGMPQTSGYEVARQIRATPDGRDVLLIAITGWAQDSDKARSRAAGFDHHLTKPIEPEALIVLISG